MCVNINAEMGSDVEDAAEIGGRSVVIVAFLQNQWFKDPQRVKDLYARYPGKREYLNRSLLFLGSKSGNRLRKAFGDLCDSIIWEETSTEVGGHSSAAFKPDPEHIAAVLEKHRPDVVLLFGALAQGAVPPLWEGTTITFPHPTNRRITENDLKEWRQKVEDAVSGAV